MRCWLCIATAVASIAGETAIASGVSIGTQSVVVSTAERTAAERLRESVAGKCQGLDVTIEFLFAAKGTPPAVAADIGGATHIYDASVPFVRDLAFDASKFDRLALVCDGPFIELTAVGVSATLTDIGKPEVHLVLSKPWRATVTFAPTGTLLKYSGLKPAFSSAHIVPPRASKRAAGR
jgi:hypothetical protein